MSEIQGKICSKCGVYQSVNDFYKDKTTKTGFESLCKGCKKKYHDSIKEHRSAVGKAYYLKNKDHVNARNRKNYANRDKDAFRKHKNEYQRTRYETNPSQRLIRNSRSRLRDAFTGRIKKSKSSEKYLGCTFAFFIEYIKKQFEPGMTMENYGDWEIDHIRPIGVIDFNNLDEIHEVLHYTNCRPLWKEANRNRPHDGSDIGHYPPR